MAIHAAKRLTGRLARVLDTLRAAGDEGATTREIIEVAHVCAVNSCVAELRTQGHLIECTMEAAGRFRYRLIEAAQRTLFVLLFCYWAWFA